MSGFQGPVELVVQRSLLLVRAYAAAHGLACVAILLCYPHSISRCLLLLALVLNGARGVAYYFRPPADTIVALKLGSRSQWLVCLRDGRELPAQLIDRPWITAVITAFSLRTSDRCRRHVLLLADNADADAVRRLRVRLRHLQQVQTAQ